MSLEEKDFYALQIGQIILSNPNGGANLVPSTFLFTEENYSYFECVDPNDLKTKYKVSFKIEKI